MKHLIIGLAVMILLVASGAQAAVEQGQVEISPVIGISIPIGDFGDLNDAGVAFGVRGAYFLSSTSSMGLSIVHNRMDFNSLFDSVLQIIIPGAKLDFSVTEVSANFRYLFSTESSVSPYINGSVGIFMNKISGTAPGLPDETDTQSEVGFGGSVGLLFKGQSNVGGFVEGLIISNSYDFDGALPGSSNYWSVRGGVSFFFGGNAPG